MFISILHEIFYNLFIEFSKSHRPTKSRHIATIKQILYLICVCLAKYSTK